MTGDRWRQDVLRWGTGPQPADIGGTLHELVLEQARRTPDALCISDDSVTLTFAETVAQAMGVAARVRELGAKPGTVVGVCADRSAALSVALLGILLAGAAYLPIDPDAPAARVKHMLSEARPVAVLVDASGEGLARAAGADRVLPLDGHGSGRPDLEVPTDPDALAYVMYTSGSTGRPKGVAVAHRAIVNRMRWIRDALPIGDGDVELQKTQFAFDVSVGELFWPMITGAHLVAPPPGAHRDPEYLVRFIRERAITVAHFVPSMLSMFLREKDADTCTSLRLVIAVGESLSPATANLTARILPGATLYNHYGPTETVVDVTTWRCRRPEPGPTVPIGLPIAGVRAYVLDAEGQLTPPGVEGELHIGGACVASGYLERPDLTAERFVLDPFVGDGARMYRTGDRVQWNPDGFLEFLGRIDHQVKMRGFRIELGEIEHVLTEHPAVTEAVVVLRDDVGPAPLLVAYAVADSAGIPVRKLREFAATRLPDYMMPGRIVVLDALPVTANGKCDRSALPKPQRESTARAGVDASRKGRR
jgi:amino acid adenylation domain-containing protein